MNTKRAKKYNMRRMFFNKDKGEQCECGALLVHVTDLHGVDYGKHCPINHAIDIRKFVNPKHWQTA